MNPDLDILTNRRVNLARIAGSLYLIIIITGMFAETFVREKLTVTGDANATALNILNSELLFRTGFAASIIMLLCDVGVTYLLYVLLKPVRPNLALLSTFFRLISISILAVSLLYMFGALFPIEGSSYLKVFSQDQLNAISYLSLKTFSHGYNISLVFFGFHCLFLGYLIYKSGFIPKVFGILIMISFLCYIVNSFAWFLFPEFARQIFPMIIVPAFIGELALTLWLIIKGVKRVY